MDLPSSALSRRRFLTGVAGVSALGALTAACGRAPGGAGGGLVSYSNKSTDYFFFIAQQEAVRRTAQQYGYSFQATNAESDSSVQFNDWNSAIIKHPKMLISDPVDSANLIPLTNRAHQQKIPVGIIDTPLSGGQADITVSFNNETGGEMAAKKIVQLLTQKHGRPQGMVLECYGDLESIAWAGRKTGIERILQPYPDIQLISRPTQGEEDQTRSVVSDTLSQHPDLDAISSPSDTLTRGVITAMRAAGKAQPAGDPGHIILVGIDGEPQSLDWIRQGIMDCGVGQDAVAYGQIVVEMLQKYAVQGKTVPLGPYQNKNYIWERAGIIRGPAGPYVEIPPFYTDKSNVNDPRLWGNVVVQKWGMKQNAAS